MKSNDLHVEIVMEQENKCNGEVIIMHYSIVEKVTVIGYEYFDKIQILTLPLAVIASLLTSNLIVTIVQLYCTI